MWQERYMYWGGKTVVVVAFVDFRWRGSWEVTVKYGERIVKERNCADEGEIVLWG